MIPYIMVEPKQWSEMIQAQADLPRWKEMCDELDARCNELKAELARLRASSFVTAVPVEQYERVVKAGDALAEAVGDPTIDWPPREAAWNAAKEGKPSA